MQPAGGNAHPDHKQTTLTPTTLPHTSTPSPPQTCRRSKGSCLPQPPACPSLVRTGCLPSMLSPSTAWSCTTTGGRWTQAWGCPRTGGVTGSLLFVWASPCVCMDWWLGRRTSGCHKVCLCGWFVCNGIKLTMLAGGTLSLSALTALMQAGSACGVFGQLLHTTGWCCDSSSSSRWPQE